MVMSTPPLPPPPPTGPRGTAGAARSRRDPRPGRDHDHAAGRCWGGAGTWGWGQVAPPCPHSAPLPVPVWRRLPQGPHRLLPRSPSPGDPAAGEGEDPRAHPSASASPLPPHPSPLFSPQLAMKGPPGPMGLTGRPGPLVSAAGVGAAAGPPPRGAHPTKTPRTGVFGHLSRPSWRGLHALLFL